MTLVLLFYAILLNIYVVRTVKLVKLAKTNVNYVTIKASSDRNKIVC